ncbi:Fungal Zn(2)-Cys(6) binuclear cluster domain-containing protein [Penicillium ucsense]|uniref:Fungal Zn(2)-Cys(6) binuclear cluster domain-containing protein n=1 Tax=Penicillium ucsense TaxID=2839758 RepID=A0A8J8WML9_9EURO|nr:Fungal Zn(2)-Cys(6) binuclear cluster domain-containing protein [Penicillium ucsense]KAF7739135.1 Fungal Zn(2)-Cys(6) binuclear cluster domain-containing protein [Penicillium ucsense]
MSSKRVLPDESSSTSADADKNNLKPHQTVFRVTLQTRKKPTEFHARRAHKKSRAGCVTCKNRRIKCDENRPTCSKCKKRGVDCLYASGESLADHGHTSSRVISRKSPTLSVSSFSCCDISKTICEALRLGSRSSSTLPSFVHERAGSMSTVAFHHFLTHSTDTVVSPAVKDVMRTDMIRVSFTSPHLMYTILAVGMLHLNRISPSKDRSIAESTFCQRALEEYQKALSSGVTENTTDALLSSCMLMSGMTVCPENFNPLDSWVLTNKPESLNWLSLQSGLRCILSLASSYLPRSIWATAFAQVDEVGDLIFRDLQQGREGMNPELADLCEIDDYSTGQTNVYFDPLRMLTSLMNLERNAENSGHCTSFMGRLECDFVALLRARDSPALLILAHWMGLMCCLSEWQPWVEGRIRGECVAICMFLEGHGDSRVRRLLRFPAGACGYKLCQIQG